MDKAFSFKDVQVDMSDIPSYASLDEAVLYVAEANESLFNNLKREIGLNELGVFETTGNTISYVVEAGEEKEGLKDKAKAAGGAAVNKGKALVDKIVKIIEAAAAKIKGLFEAGMRKINELTTKATSAFGKRLNVAKIKEALGDKTIAFQSGDYKQLENFIAKAKEGGNGFFSFRDVMKSNGVAINKAEVSAFFEGKVENQTLSAKDNSIDQIASVVQDFKAKNDAVKRMYKGCADSLDKTKKEIKSAKEVDSERLASVQKNISDYTIIYGAALATYYKLVRLDVGLLIKAAGKASKLGKAADAAKEKADEKKAQKQAAEEFAANGGVAAGESAVVESAVVEEEPATKTYTEEVESLFNWSF